MSEITTMDNRKQYGVEYELKELGNVVLMNTEKTTEEK